MGFMERIVVSRMYKEKTKGGANSLLVGTEKGSLYRYWASMSDVLCED